ncbi:MAG: Rieske 2Fe-2S domain-containing protein [Thermoplasmata archaeon]|nr:Rieske 2Fe-2S domain-containing protein [Thermoplasmata archaeon]
MVFQKAIRAADIPDGAVAGAVVNKRDLAIIRRGDVFYALDGTCTHEAGPLGEGSLDGDELVCPWHEGRYKIASGEANPDTDWVRDITSYPVKVEDGYVWVDV